MGVTAAIAQIFTVTVLVAVTVAVMLVKPLKEVPSLVDTPTVCPTTAPVTMTAPVVQVPAPASRLPPRLAEVPNNGATPVARAEMYVEPL